MPPPPLWPDQAIVHHKANPADGRDFVVTDVHGHFDTLTVAEIQTGTAQLHRFARVETLP